MNRVLILLIATATLGQGFAADQCDCTIYPFTPNPPCYGKCVGQLTSLKGTDFSKIKQLDPGVAVGLKVIASRPDKSAIDFSKIKGKKDLEGLALESLESSKKFELVPVESPGPGSR
ncbi:hypothetical protein [Ideonella sp.]|uniref:hypothetical protein n=1 Tax=Ideonella sp. TaxID=1929293 RepID=UPI0035B42146